MTHTALATGVQSVNSIGTTHDTFGLGAACRQVAVTNSHATQVLYVHVYSGTTAAGALAAAVAGTAVTTATLPDVFRIPAASGRRVVARSGLPRFYCLDVIASGASTTFDVEGTAWAD